MTREQQRAHISSDSGVFWRKARASQGGGACVEVAHLAGGGAAVRDSKDPAGPVLTFTAGEWSAFLAGVRDGEFDPVAASS